MNSANLDEHIRIWLSGAKQYLQTHGAGILDASRLSDDETIETASHITQHGILAVPIRLRSSWVSNCFILVANDQDAIDHTISKMQQTIDDYAGNTEAELILLKLH